VAGEGVPVNAADVLAQAEDDWIDEDAPPDATDPGLLYPFMVAALLAHGEQGVVILPDGTLWALETTTLERITVTPELRLLVPLSAEAGDQGTWMGGGLEITYPSAEAGDTEPFPGAERPTGVGGQGTKPLSAEAGDTDG
jgi:hypothetical protein